MANDNELQLDDVLSIFQKHWKFILFPGLIAAFLAAIISLSLPKTYESYSLIKIGSGGSQMLESIPSIREIMNAQPMIEEIRSRIGVSEDNTSFAKKIEYQDVSGILKIRALSDSPEKAMKIVQAATDVVIVRHDIFYQERPKNITDVVKFVKDTVKPIPLSSGISEFKTERTIVAISPILIKKPVESYNKLITLGAFFIIIFINTLISFYLERRAN